MAPSRLGAGGGDGGGVRRRRHLIYTDPPLGRVFRTEAEARAKGHAVRIGKRPMTRVSRAVEKGETQGFMKVVVDRDSDAILGAAISASAATRRSMA